MDQQQKGQWTKQFQNSTPGGRPTEKLENPPSGEAEPMDSGEGQLLLVKDAYVKEKMVKDTTPKY